MSEELVSENKALALKEGEALERITAAFEKMANAMDGIAKAQALMAETFAELGPKLGTVEHLPMRLADMVERGFGLKAV